MPKAIQTDFKSIFEAAPGLNVILSPDLTIVAVSDAYLQATMTKRTGIIGHHLFEIFPDNPADSSPIGDLRFSLNYVLEHKAAHTMAVQKYDIRKPDGTFEERYWSLINKPVLDSGNAVEYIIHRVEDITEFILMKKEQEEKEDNVAGLQLQIEENEIETYKRAQEIQKINQKLLTEIKPRKKSEEILIEINNELDLRVLERTSEILKSKNALAETLERITDAFVTLDKNWCYTYVNSKAEQIFNRPPGYLIGKHIWTEFPEGIDQPFYKAYFRAMEEQQYIHLEEYYQPYDRWFESRIYPSPEGLTVFIHEITEKKKREEDLIEAEKQLSFIANNVPVFIAHCDTQKRFKFVNRMYADLFGLKSSDFTGKHAKDILGEKAYAIASPYLDRVLEGNNSEFENVLPLTLKGPRTVCVKYVPEFDKEGKVIGFIAAISDITERKKAEEAISISNFSLSEVQRIARIGNWTYYMNGEFNWSDNMYQLYGLPSKITAPTPAFFLELVHPDDREKMQQLMQACLAGKTTCKYEFRSLLPDGSLHYYSGSGEMKYDADNTPVYLRGTVQDITEQMKAQEEISREKSLSDSIINSLPGVFYMFNTKGRFLRWNKNLETVTKYSADEIRTLHPIDLFDEDEKDLISKKISSVFESGEDTVQANFLLKTKEKIPYYFTGMRIEYDGTPCLVGVGIDFSELTIAHEKIKETSVQLRRLAVHLQTIREEERKRIGREIHDELGQQLTAIKMDVAWIDKKTTDEQTIVKGKLKNIIKLLDGSNLSVRKILNELRPAILDDHSLLDALEWQNHQFTETTGIPVRFTASQQGLKLSEEIITCIFRVYQESLTNIMRYSEASLVLTSLIVRDGSLIFTIEDDGKGFDFTLMQNKKSFGILGMKERVLSVNGTFVLDSTPGKGTKISLIVPYNITT